MSSRARLASRGASAAAAEEEEGLEREAAAAPTIQFTETLPGGRNPWCRSQRAENCSEVAGGTRSALPTFTRRRPSRDERRDEEDEEEEEEDEEAAATCEYASAPPPAAATG